MLITSLPGETVHGKMQLPFFSLFTAVMLKWKALNQQQEDSETYPTDFQRGISDKYRRIVKSLLVVHHNMVLHAGLSSPLFMSAWMTLWMPALFTDQRMSMMLQIQLLHLKSDLTLSLPKHLYRWWKLPPRIVSQRSFAGQKCSFQKCYSSLECIKSENWSKKSYGVLQTCRNHFAKGIIWRHNGSEWVNYA